MSFYFPLSFPACSNPAHQQVEETFILRVTLWAHLKQSCQWNLTSPIHIFSGSKLNLASLGKCVWGILGGGGALCDRWFSLRWHQFCPVMDCLFLWIFSSWNWILVGLYSDHSPHSCQIPFPIARPWCSIPVRGWGPVQTWWSFKCYDW